MDTDLAATGKDTTIEVLYMGQVVKVLEKVKFSVKAVIAKTETKPLGTTVRQINTEPEGWSGTIEVAVSRKDADELMDLVTTGEILRVPGLLAITETTKYRDLSKKTYIYPDAKISDFEKSGSRGENTNIKFSWETGQNRIAA